MELNEIRVSSVSGLLNIESKYEDRVKIGEIYNKYIKDQNVIINHKFFKIKEIESKNPFRLINNCQIEIEHTRLSENEYYINDIRDHLKLFIDKRYGLFKDYNINGIYKLSTSVTYPKPEDVVYSGSFKNDSLYDYLEFYQIKVVNNKIMTRHLNIWSDWNEQ